MFYHYYSSLLPRRINISRLCCYTFILLIVLTTLISPLTYAELSSKQPQLVLLIWPDYVDPALLEKFEREHNIKVTEVNFESDDDRDQLMTTTDSQGFDVVLVNDAAVNAYKQLNWLTPLDKKLIPNLKHIDKRWYAPGNKHTVPYLWGTAGIAYRKDLLKVPITSWQQIFKPDQSLSNKISMFSDARILVGMTLKSLGYSANSTEPDRLKKAKKALLQQKPHVAFYGVLSLQKSSPLVTGRLTAAMSYSGDALTLKEFNDNIEYVVPKEGGGLWLDYLAITASSNKKNLAAKFINFLNEPENASQLAQYLYYATPNAAAEKLLPDDFISNPIIYPNKNILKKSELTKELPADTLKEINLITIDIIR